MKINYNLKKINFRVHFRINIIFHLYKKINKNSFKLNELYFIFSMLFIRYFNS